MLSWGHLTQPDFDRTVELLITRWYGREHPELLVQAIDGRGGDGGVDIEVREPVTDKLLKIYQLKFFPEGFSGGHSGRKNQIRSSFEQAAKLHPPVWALVIPRNFTTNERKWVTTLLKDSGIRPEFVGRTELDSLQADDPHAIALTQRTSDREALSLVGRESAALLSLEDIAEEALRTAARTDSISPNWGFQVTTHGNIVQNTLFAKHPDAPIREPLSIRLETNFANEPELGERFRESFRYGITEPLVLPASVVSSLEHIGPSWFEARPKGSLEVVELHPSSEAHQSLPVTLRVAKANGQGSLVLRGTTSLVTAGEEGSKIRTKFSGGLEILWKLAFDPGEGALVTPTFEPQGEVATDVHRSIQVLTAIANGASIDLEANGTRTKLLGDPNTSTFSVQAESIELAEDLALIERETGVQFAFPVELSKLERIWIRVVRYLLEGRCVLAPDTRSFSFRFSGVLNEQTEMLLTEPCMFLATHNAWSASILGETVVVGDVAYYHPSIQIPDSEAHLEALKAGLGANRPGEAVPTDENVGFRLYSPSRTTKSEAVVPTPWRLSRIEEHPELEQPKRTKALNSPPQNEVETPS